jgi:hypothetical protein
MSTFKDLSKFRNLAKKEGVEIPWRDLVRLSTRLQTIKKASKQMIKQTSKSNTNRLLATQAKEITGVRQSGNIYRQYSIDVGSVVKPANQDKILGVISNFLKLKRINKNEKVKVVLLYKGSEAWGTEFLNASELIGELEERFDKYMLNYDAEIKAHTIVIETVRLGDVKKNIFGQGGEGSIETFDDWNVIGNKTKTNCLYHAFVISDYEGVPETINNISKNLKKHLKPINKEGSQYEDIEKLAKYKKCNIILHDGKKEVMKVFEGTPRKAETVKRKDIHIVYDNNHYMGMFKGEVKIDKPIEKHTKAGAIKKRFRENGFHDSFMSWDIEASPDCNNNFKAYAVGFYDGSKYFDSWGLDCLEKFEEYLYENRNEYNNKVLYAHNGGKFDMLLMMSEVLLDSDRFEIVTTGMGCLELNGRWLNVTLKSDDGCKIHFRDSCALLPGSLESLTKDFRVEHQKLPETVNHDQIKLDNWHTWKELPKYLKHDVLGLFECLEKFNNDVWDATTMNRNSRELFCKDVIEVLCGKKFFKVRPKWLVFNGKKLELDIYNEDLKIAIEHNGEQHYKLCMFNKYDKKVLQEQKANDEAKKVLCKENGVKLITIPYWMKKDEIVDKIKQETGINKEINLSNLGIMESGINITECLTGASLSKKFFFMKYYDQFNKPVWTLDDETDKYIRGGYFGGRVEIFNFGEVKDDKYYYYDFTSLFPAMALKDLPYGEPKNRDKQYIEDNINNFFGFIRCRVTSKHSNLKPLHAVYDGGKLKFMKLYKRELTLFSEELKLGKNLDQYDYEILDGIEFKKGKVMEKMSRDVFSFKAKAKAEGKDALSLVWKIILNSSYGFWGLRTHNRDAVKVFKRGQAPVQSYLSSGKLKDEVDIGKYTLLNVLNDLEIVDYNVGIASAITSYARCELWSLIRDIQIRKGKVYMVDTDSVICSVDLNDYPELKDRYQWDGCGDELGTLKNELNDAIKKKYK